MNFTAEAQRRRVKPKEKRGPGLSSGASPSAPSATSALSGFDFLFSLRLCVSAVNQT